MRDNYDLKRVKGSLFRVESVLAVGAYVIVTVSPWAKL